SMSAQRQQLSQTPVLVYPSPGPILLGSEGDANDLIGDSWGHETGWVAVPVNRISEDFFRLSTGVAGGIVQKFVNYRIKLVIVGDVTPYTETSSAFADFVTESNRGSQTWFVPDITQLRDRLTARQSRQDSRLLVWRPVVDRLGPRRPDDIRLL
ncbi:MAG: DUF4180 domain-containing protein, partial [Stackebrandtia sp.]